MDKVLSVLRPLAPVTSVTDSEPECEPGEQLRQRRGGSRGGQTRGRGRNAGEYQRNGRGRGRGRSGTLNVTAALCDANGDEATADPEDAEALPKARSTGSSSSKKTQLKVAEAEGETSDQKAPMKKHPKSAAKKKGAGNEVKQTTTGNKLGADMELDENGDEHGEEHEEGKHEEGKPPAKRARQTKHKTPETSDEKPKAKAKHTANAKAKAASAKPDEDANETIHKDSKDNAGDAEFFVMKYHSRKQASVHSRKTGRQVRGSMVTSLASSKRCAAVLKKPCKGS